MKNKFLKGVFASFALAASGIANASIIPYGAQIDVSSTTVTDDWGWNECYVTPGNSRGIATSTVLSGCTGNSLMMGVRLVGSDTYDLLGAASFETVTEWVNLQSGSVVLDNWENGLNWYFNDYSWGFTTGNEIFQRSADTNIDVNWGSENNFNNVGLSWHTDPGVNLTAGWRFNKGGTAINANNSYERVWLTANVQEVPEPSTVAIFALGLMGLASRKFKKQA